MALRLRLGPFPNAAGAAPEIVRLDRSYGLAYVTALIDHAIEARSVLVLRAPAARRGQVPVKPWEWWSLTLLAEESEDEG